MLAVLVWFCAPGLLLTANGLLFVEPVAMAYALGGGIILIIARIEFGKIEPAKALVPLALLAGLVVHARPHLAVGYYAGVVLLAGYAA